MMSKNSFIRLFFYRRLLIINILRKKLDKITHANRVGENGRPVSFFCYVFWDFYRDGRAILLQIFCKIVVLVYEITSGDR